MLAALVMTACESDCKPEGHLYRSSLELLNTQCKSIIGQRISVIGYMYDDTASPEIPRYLLLPGSDYAELNDGNRLVSSLMLFFPNNERIKLPQACVGRMVEVKGTAGIFSGVAAIKDIEMIVHGPGTEICYPELKVVTQ